jgi:hypothetical protein
MNNNYGTDTQYPTVNLAVKKSRLKLYDNRSVSPTYFLTKGQEFQIELFNPTTFILLAKIKLNGNAISGGGLVIRPGERIFLERFLEENKKFLFDTYQVDNIAAVKKAIAENGDLVVDFYKEKVIPKLDINGNYDLRYNSLGLTQDIFIPCRSDSGGTDGNNFLGGGAVGNIGLNHIRGTAGNNGPSGPSGLDGSVSYNSSAPTTNTIADGNTTVTNTVNFAGNSTTYSHDINISAGNVTLDSMEPELSRSVAPVKKDNKRRRITKAKSIETGRVTKGSNSNQVLEEVSLDFEWNVFHSVEYKMLPLSQKTYDSKEIKQRYCGDCGKKLKPTHKFCPNCGEEQ